MFQFQNQSLRPLTTAHLAQTMTLLGMTIDELNQKIDTELAKNPALELIDDRRCPTCRRPLRTSGPCPICSRPKSLASDEPIVFVSSRTDGFDYSNRSQHNFDTDNLPEDNIAPEEDLPTYVLRQIAAELAAEDRLIAAYILTNLDEDGFLQTTPFEISRYHHISVTRVTEIIHIIQQADPIGVGSASPQEALLVQLEVLQNRKVAVPPLAWLAVEEGLQQLSRHQYQELGRILGVSTTKAKETAHFISSNLNPFPGRAHWGDGRQNSSNPIQVYHQPDVIIRPLNQAINSSLVVEILMPLRGSLQINRLFKETLKEAPSEKLEKWKKDLETANLLIKCIQQRNNTMRRLMSFLVGYQRDFILKGDQHLRPITRAKVAGELDVHESTISRAVAGKCLQLPTGRIIPINRFFDRSLSVRAHLKEIIRTEEATLTDSQLMHLLAKKGYKIARRTVAKYRAMEGILPAHLRKNLAH
jgi:RNA polymerase sigma-54 factor